jgi:3-oxoacyl-[acyl-carrier protein] reductase
MTAETAPSGRRVIVTGATGGIGRAIVEALTARECLVAACDVSGAPVAELGAMTTAEFDVSDREAVRAGVDAAIAALGGCDSVVANAGIVDTIHRAEHFSAEIGIPGQVAYGASKAGLVGMARTLAGEWAPRGIRCNVVMPGFIATPKVQAMPEKVQATLSAAIPLGRFGATEELAGAVSFLLSPAAAYINGAVLRVDGGLGLSPSAIAG